MRHCVVIPTYNNAATLERVVRRTLDVCPDVVVVNDGSSDSTLEILADFPTITIVTYPTNKGKGYALCRGFEKAKELGFNYAVTIDSDLQHYPEEIPLLTEAAAGRDNILIVGARQLQAEGMPRKNTFANRFSNFWFAVQTFRSPGDTQSGFRLYSLDNLPSFKVISNRYEAELALLVLSAWRGVRIESVPIRVYYPPREERVSHFRPFADFLRISVLNTVLCPLALVYGYPSMLIHWIAQGTRRSKQ